MQSLVGDELMLMLRKVWYCTAGVLFATNKYSNGAKLFWGRDAKPLVTPQTPCSPCQSTPDFNRARFFGTWRHGGPNGNSVSVALLALSIASTKIVPAHAAYAPSSKPITTLIQLHPGC